MAAGVPTKVGAAGVVGHTDGMNTSSDSLRSRQPKGSPTGGQYAPIGRAEPVDLDLSPVSDVRRDVPGLAADPREPGQGVWVSPSGVPVTERQIAETNLDVLASMYRAESAGENLPAADPVTEYAWRYGFRNPRTEVSHEVLVEKEARGVRGRFGVDVWDVWARQSEPIQNDFLQQYGVPDHRVDAVRERIHGVLRDEG